MKFSRLGKGEGLDHMTIIGHMIISWDQVDLFMNYSWTVHVPFLKIVHEQIMNYTCSSWTIHELTSSWIVHEPHQLHELGHFMFMDSSWIVHE